MTPPSWTPWDPALRLRIKWHPLMPHYSISIIDGPMSIGDWRAWTMAGAERKGRRILRRMVRNRRRADQRNAELARLLGE